MVYIIVVFMLSASVFDLSHVLAFVSLVVAEWIVDFSSVGTHPFMFVFLHVVMHFFFFGEGVPNLEVEYFLRQRCKDLPWFYLIHVT